jgi:hypothetical protein
VALPNSLDLIAGRLGRAWIAPRDSGCDEWQGNKLIQVSERTMQSSCANVAGQLLDPAQRLELFGLHGNQRVPLATGEESSCF